MPSPITCTHSAPDPLHTGCVEAALAQGALRVTHLSRMSLHEGPCVVELWESAGKVRTPLAHAFVCLQTLPVSRRTPFFSHDPPKSGAWGHSPRSLTNRWSWKCEKNSTTSSFLRNAKYASDGTFRLVLQACAGLPSQHGASAFDCTTVPPSPSALRGDGAWTRRGPDPSRVWRAVVASFRGKGIHVDDPAVMSVLAGATQSRDSGLETLGAGAHTHSCPGDTSATRRGPRTTCPRLP